MRLWHVRSSKLHSFNDSGEDTIPPYAILTHTWTEDEVTFRDLVEQHVESIIGYMKIRECCKQAVRANLDYIWIDTFCINQGHSAELSEAINSMYKWYKNSTQCFAFLFDVRTKPGDLEFEYEFARCRWFTRGWTLQELLAPEEIQFFNADWEFIGSKRSLSEAISAITGINKEILLTRNIGSVSVATRMSWASHRKTARQEDQAYCLLGIFDVSMPPIYGEGMNKAFIRLQEEIVKEMNDQSLFAWDVPTRIARHSRLWGDAFGILAFAPECFSSSGGIVPIPSTSMSTYRMTNNGLKIRLQLLPADEEGRYTALLECQREDSLGECIGITLSLDGETGRYCRDKTPMQMISFQDVSETKRETIYISKHWYRPVSRPHYCICWVQSTSLREFGFEITRVHPPGSQWSPKTQAMKMQPQPGRFAHQAAFLFSNDSTQRGFLVAISINHDHTLGALKILPKPENLTLLFAQPLENRAAEQDASQRLGSIANFKLDRYQIFANVDFKSIIGSNIWVLTVEARLAGGNSFL